MHGRYLLSILKGFVYDDVKVWVGIPVRPGKSLAPRFAAVPWLSLGFRLAFAWLSLGFRLGL